MKKVLTVFGTRPEAIKMAPVVKELEKHPDEITSVVCVTGQHREMLDQILQVFDIVPQYDLAIMKKGQDLFDISARVLLGLKEVLIQEKPDIVLVHGDTTSSIFAALAAYYLQIPVGHVEAGLRTNNMYSPFPEEINRQMTGRVATYHFCPTERAKANLLAENVCASNIYITGNTVIDALYYANDLFDQDTAVKQQIAAYIADHLPLSLETLIDTKYILVTGHRRENFGEGIDNLCAALAEITNAHPDWYIIYPVHLNPNVWQPVNERLASYQNILLTGPMDYLPFIFLMKHARIVLTDSGGIQEEAPSFGVPVLVTRDNTERPEAVEAGTVKLVGSDKDNIVAHLSELIENQAVYNQMAAAVNPYGDGRAAGRIIQILKTKNTP